MPCRFFGLAVPFTHKASWDIQPGSVPGDGGLYDEYHCDGCGWVYNHRVWGCFQAGEKEMLDHAVMHELTLHAQNCMPKLEAGCPLCRETFTHRHASIT